MSRPLSRSTFLGVTLVMAASLLSWACSDEAASGPDAASSSATGASAGATASLGSDASATAMATLEPNEQLYIAHTGGTGVRLRPECADDASADGAWAEGTPVRLVRVGDGACAGWLTVERDGIVSWVRETYTSREQPPTVARPSGGTATQSGSASLPAATSASGRQLIEVIVYDRHLIPVDQLEYRAPSATFVNGTAHACASYSWHTKTSVVTLAGERLTDPAPLDCGFGNIETTERRTVLAP